MNEIEKEIEEITEKAIRKDEDRTMCDLLDKEIEELTNQKEIEEMAKSIYESKVALDGTDLAFGLIGDDDHFHRIAIYLYNAGYRNVKEIIDKVDDMIGGKMIAQALREIYEVE